MVGFKILYIDPQSGSLFFQLLLSGILSIAVFFKQIVAIIKGFFGRKKNKDENNAE